ncbi:MULTISPECIES: SDR family NAD(P)-dependent oxidoreductase [Azohydromonas]|uniref:SDR family oxidoreductase n=1 Tax=Azohydromonas lata TaxID=45677 RepID=A0ABU5I829_9BURK|nr:MULTISPECIES: SDR family oxidoreductase [Azohydromonas]MDZ5455138.1 SDR family oxidoreductase [Azohydromonas lata]
MTARLEGKVAIVTGSGHGIGAETARVLAAQGARVAVVDIELAAAQGVAAQIDAAGGQALAVQVDVTSEESIRAMVSAVVERFGRIDVLHNNAAALDTAQRQSDRDVCNVDVAAWDKALDVNARGAMLCCKHVVPHMLEAGGGSIIFATSGFGQLGDVTLTAYAASKAALMALARSVAAQYGKQGIRSNAIMIGFVINDHAQKTVPEEIKQILLEQHLTPELGRPRQIADVVAFLASEESSFITGAVIPVDGGFTSHSPAMVPLRQYFERQGSNKL